MDKYDEKAEELVRDEENHLMLQESMNAIAKALREAAADAFEEAAKDAAFYDKEGVTLSGLTQAQAIRDTLRRRAADLRAGRNRK